jgi:hypothetical protein
MWNIRPSLSSIASSPRTEIDSLMQRGLLCSGLGRISSISIMPTQRTAIKGKVYAGVVSTDSTHDEGVNADTVRQAEVDDEILD